MMDSITQRSWCDTVFNKRVGELPLNENSVSCSRTSSLAEVAGKLSKNHIGSVILVEGDRPIGIFTERDWMQKIAESDIDLELAEVGDYATMKLVCLNANSPVSKVMAAMRLGRFRHLILTHDDGTLAKVVSIKDLLDHLIDTIHECPSVELLTKK